MTESEQAARALRPDAAAIAATRFSDNATIAGELLPTADRRLLDIGCGAGKFTRLMAKRGANVSGIDANAEVVAEAERAAAEAGLAIAFHHGRGEALPFGDGTFDVVVFSNSLHHMSDMAGALREAARLLPDGGVLYVMEPVAWGNYHDATKAVNDETEVRAAAYAALAALPEAGLAAQTELLYRVRRQFAAYEEWRDAQLARGEKRRALFAAREAEIRDAFEAAAARTAEGLSLDQLFRVNLFRKGS
ncbi:MAG: class I SAM-dependent methyltransferase [Alphaproteobacteria bacterium]